MKENNNLYNQIIEYAIKEILNNNLDNALRSIYNYLIMINKSEYEFLVYDLIKISILENDTSFIRLKDLLQNINDDFIFQEKEYIKNLYESLTQGKTEIAKVYLDIITRARRELKCVSLKETDSNSSLKKYYRNVANSRISNACKGTDVSFSKFSKGIKLTGINYKIIPIGHLVLENPNMFIKVIEVSAKALDGSLDKSVETSEFITSVNEYILKNRGNIDFNQNKLNKNYGINNFDVIEHLVYNQNMSILEACMQNNLNREGIDVVKLMFARNCYTNEDYTTGDLIIKNVEQSKYKTPFVINLMNEIRKNKRFYKNRKTEENFVKKISL